MSFKLHVQETGGGFVVAPVGAADHDACERFETDVMKLIERNPRLLVLDLSELTHIPSMGLSAIIRIHRAMRERSGKLRVAAVPAPIMQLLQATKLDIMLPIFMTRADACRTEGLEA